MRLRAVENFHAPELVEVTICAMSAISLLKDLPLAEPGDVDEIDAPEEFEEEEKAPGLEGSTGDRAATILDSWFVHVFSKMPKQSAIKLHRTEGGELPYCIICKKDFDSDHGVRPEDRECVECDRCKNWAVFSCAGIAIADKPILQIEGWRCPQCRTTRA